MILFVYLIVVSAVVMNVAVEFVSSVFVVFVVLVLVAVVMTMVECVVVIVIVIEFDCLKSIVVSVWAIVVLAHVEVAEPMFVVVLAALFVGQDLMQCLIGSVVFVDDFALLEFVVIVEAELV